MKPRTMSADWDRGRLARIAGKTRAANPWRTHRATRRRLAWLAGWLFQDDRQAPAAKPCDCNGGCSRAHADQCARCMGAEAAEAAREERDPDRQRAEDEDAERLSDEALRAEPHRIGWE